jgi:hypothetical protein
MICLRADDVIDYPSDMKEVGFSLCAVPGKPIRTLIAHRPFCACQPNDGA